MLDDVRGERLDLDAYLDDFDSRFEGIRDDTVWKLERRQSFRQPESPSWVAFSQGDWDEALRLLETNRVGIEQEFRKIGEAGVSVQRARVVEKPIAPYLHWELYSLHLRVECGESIRVVERHQVAPFETKEPLPELVTLGDAVLYKLVYTEEGLLDGAVRFIDQELARQCRGLIKRLYDSGEDLATFFVRDVSSLGPSDGA